MELTVDVPHLWPPVLPEQQAELLASQGTKAGSVRPEKLANRNELQVKTIKIKPFSAGFPFQRLLGLVFFRELTGLARSPVPVQA